YHGNPAINPSNPSIALLFLLFFQNSTFTQGFGDGVTNKRLCFDTVWGTPQQAKKVSCPEGGYPFSVLAGTVSRRKAPPAFN
ncbi:hypothetical protein, partial [Eubacterium callanderi]|uniref:hypothetical protein n=1 Tax=Eubacterium callanderi TaxID=53442 RepID=UPI003AEF58CA